MVHDIIHILLKHGITPEVVTCSARDQGGGRGRDH